MDAHWSFVAREKERESPANVFPSFTVFCSPHFLGGVFNASRSFQAGCDLWRQAAVEEEETVGQQRKGMWGEWWTDTGRISG